MPKGIYKRTKQHIDQNKKNLGNYLGMGMGMLGKKHE